MEDYLWIGIIISVSILWGIISWIVQTISNSNKYKELKPKLDNLDRSIREHNVQVQKDKDALLLKARHYEEEAKRRNEEIEKRANKKAQGFMIEKYRWEEKVQQDKEAIQKIAKQKSMGFPWLADAYAEYFVLKDLVEEEYLKTKKHPAHTAAETIRAVKEQKKVLLRENKVVRYKISYFEKLFPWLSDLIAIDEDDEIPVRMDPDEDEGDIEVEKHDRVKDWLTPEEYKELPSVERNQRALDRYVESRHKSKWNIGRDYEMYVGYLYEQKGYSIEDKGIIDGFDDLGRDIIAIKDDGVCIIQCKHWAQYKEIHEKHIFQLFGTMMEYWIQKYMNYREVRNFEEFAKFLNENKLRPIFFTSTRLSDKAKEMADALSVEIVENSPLGNFPRIKCNTNYDEFGSKTKIYHLPMDQQYDRTIITRSKGEFYAFTVKEAENAGFRRAFKHRF